VNIRIETADMLVKEILSRNLRDRRAVALCRPHGLARREREETSREGARPIRQRSSAEGDGSTRGALP